MEEKIINVRFDACGGSTDIESLSYKRGEPLGTMPKPERKGYIFDGWYTAAESGEKLTSSDSASFEGDCVLFAHWIKTAKNKKKRSLYRKQKRAIIIVGAIVLLLAIALPLVNHFVERNVFYDIDPDKTKYYVQKKDGEYAIYNKAGVILPVTKDGFYSTEYGTLVKVDPDEGSCQIVGVIGDIEEGSSELIDYNTVRYLMFPTVFQEDYDYVEITNDYGTLKFVLDNNDIFWIDGEEAHTYLDEAYYIMCARIATAFGYTLAKEKLKSPKKLEGSDKIDFAEYGLVSEIRVDENGNEYTYTPAKYTIKTKSGVTHTVIVGDPIMSDAGYYAMYEGRDAVYILGTDLVLALSPIETFLSPAMMFPTTTSNYYDVENFLLLEHDYSVYNETKNKDDIISNPIICFSYIPLEERENQIHTTSVFKILSTNLDKYLPNSDEILNNVLTKLRKAQILGCVKYGVSEMTDEHLDSYGLLSPKYSITFKQNNISYNVSSSNKYYSATNVIFISEMTKEGTYYVYSDLWNMIIEVDGDTFEFLNYSPIKWIDRSFFSVNIAYMERLQLTTPDMDKVFTFNNSESDQTEGPNADNIKVFVDGQQLTDLDNFTEFYKVLIFSSIEGDIDVTTPPDGAELQLRIKYTAEDLTGGVEEKTFEFYRISEGKSLIFVDSQGGFYVTNARVEKIINDLGKLLNGEAINSEAKN